MSALYQATLGGMVAPDEAIGYEPVTRAVRLLLADRLADELAVEAERWRSADLQLQQMGFDPGVGQIDLEPIPNSHLHEGPHESLLMAPAESFPNVSMMAYLHAPSASQMFDTFDSHDITLFVETMVKSGPVTPGTEVAHETIVHRRIQRTTEAVNRVVRGDLTLLGTVMPQELPPRGGIGRQAWVQNNQNETGQRFMWHGSRLQYTLKRATTIG